MLTGATKHAITGKWVPARSAGTRPDAVQVNTAS